MKKLLGLLVATMMVFSLTACSSDTAADDTTAGDEVTVNAVEAAATAYFAEFDGNNIVAWADVFAMIDAGDAPYILSIRSADDYAAGHIEGAVNAAWGADLASKVAMLPTDQPVYVYCYSGQTAGQTVALLNMMGVEAYSIKSGFVNGAMTTEGYEAYVSTDAVEMSDAGASFDADVLAFVQDYFNAIPEGGSNIVAATDAQPLIEAGDKVVMDIRSADDYAAGHIEGAINVPYGAGMQENFAQFEGQSIVVTCYSGQTAGQTVAILRALGYDAVSLKSGMGGWTGSELPVVTE